MARVNVEDEVWIAFRVEAVRANTSVAAYLGALVRREIARLDERVESTPAGDGLQEAVRGTP